jgi:hypothetical protein
MDGRVHHVRIQVGIIHLFQRLRLPTTPASVTSTFAWRIRDTTPASSEVPGRSPWPDRLHQEGIVLDLTNVGLV